MRHHYALMGAFLTLNLSLLGVRAADPDNTPAPAPVKAEETRSAPPESTSMLEQENLTGDWGGLRKKLSDKGVAFGVNEIDEILGNPSGGIDQGMINGGRLELTLDLDFKAMVGLEGSSFHANAYYIYGSDLSAGKIGNIFPVSNLEAYDTLRLFDLWYQQEFLDGKVSLRFGQIAADDEFLVSDYGATFINGTFGWPALTAANLPSGGPGYPLATPGVRLKIEPIEQVSFMAAVFDGDPGDRGENPQKKDNTGTNIDFNQGAFSMFEAAYKWNQEKDAKGLPGTYKLGGFYATQNFSDERTDGNGLSLADPASSGSPRNHSGDWGIYFVADQMVYREPTPAADKPKNPKDLKDAKNVADAGEPSDQGLGLLVRVGGTPTDRNLVQFYADGGLKYKGLIPGRDDDVLGLAVAYAQISNDLRAFDRDSNAFTGVDAPIQDSEIAIELTYQAKIAPWWVVQPDIQYIIHPGGNVSDPNDAAGTSSIPNALVLGLRTSISF